MDKKKLIRIIRTTAKKEEKENKAEAEKFKKENVKLVKKFFSMWKKFSDKNEKDMKDLLEVSRELFEKTGRMFNFTKPLDDFNLTTFHYFLDQKNDDYFIASNSNEDSGSIRFSIYGVLEVSNKSDWVNAENYFIRDGLKRQNNDAMYPISPSFLNERIKFYLIILEKLVSDFDRYKEAFEEYIRTGFKTDMKKGMSEKSVPKIVVESMKKPNPTWSSKWSRC